MPDILTLAEGVQFDALIKSGLRTLMIFAGAYLLYRLVGRLSQRLVRMVYESDDELVRVEKEKRAKTLAGIFKATSTVIILIVGAIMILREIGFNVAPILAGAGILGLAVGFGAQNLVRDVITGFFILLENQYGVGDVVKVNNVAGVVENIGLRTTVLKDIEGITHIIPNGSISLVSNMTKESSQALIDVEVAYKEDLDRVHVVLVQIGEELREDSEYGSYILEDAQVLGVEAFGSSGVTIRMICKTVSNRKWAVARELRRRIKARFDAEGIEIPYPHQKVFFHNENGNGPKEPASIHPDSR